MSTVFLIGGSSFIGKNLVEYLLAKYHIELIDSIRPLIKDGLDGFVSRPWRPKRIRTGPHLQFQEQESR